jgi:hypothetical protein
MPIAKVQMPDGRIAKFEVPEGTTPDQVVSFASQMKTPEPEKPVNPTDDMSTTDKLLAGAGKAFSDIGQGVKQSILDSNPVNAGLAISDALGDPLGVSETVNQYKDDLNQEIEQTRERDAPLMDTGAGFTGNIAGNVAAFTPAMFVPGANTVAGATLTGGAMGSTQPVLEAESRLLNTTIGAVSGAGGQVIGQKIGSAISNRSANKASELAIKKSANQTQRS